MKPRIWFRRYFWWCEVIVDGKSVMTAAPLPDAALRLLRSRA